MDDLIARAEAGFTRAFGGRPDGCWLAPGRVNLLGEHTDYNDGYVLPFGIGFYTAAAVSTSTSPTWQVWSEATGETVTFGPSRVSSDPDRFDPIPGWAAYVAGVVWALSTLPGVRVGGARIAIASDVPLGAGMSSSAALEMAVIRALVDLYDLDVSLVDQVMAARRAENDYVGAPTGMLDQTASLLSMPGHALFIDCRSFGVEPVPFDPEKEGLELIVVDTHVRHAHAGGEYADRRRDCERAAEALGVHSLRDVSDLRYLDLPDRLLRRRVRHVVSENARTARTARALVDGTLTDLRYLGETLTESHLSLMADFEVSCPELDTVVRAAIDGGAWGARMMGGGFGGSVIALVNADRSDAMCDVVIAAAERAEQPKPTFYLATPSAGAARID